MKNWGQIARKIKPKKHYIISPHVLNLSEEARQWAQLSKALQKRIKRYGTD